VGICRREAAYGVVAELRAADAAVHAVEQTDEMQTVGPFHRRPIALRARGCRGGRPRAGHRQPRIDTSDVQDRLRLEVEDRRILAEVRDLDDAAAPCSIVDQERLVALTAEIDGGALDAEELRSNCRHLIRRKARRRRLEHAHGASP
jgi:hypothetical protein